MTIKKPTTTRRRRAAHEQQYRRAAIIAGLALLAITAVVFSDAGRSNGDFELRAAFASANHLRPGSSVRVAGVEVGTVREITAGKAHTSVVSMRISDTGLPIHADATAAIKARLILEGNFYVDLQPGSPGTSSLPSGGTLPIGQTTTPVQIDQVLNVFDIATRKSLQSAFSGLANGLGGGNRPAAAAGASGADGLRDAAEALDRSLVSIRRVADDVQGTAPGDLARAVKGTRNFTAQLAESPAALADLVTNFRTVMGSLAADDAALAAGVQELDAVVRSAPPALTSLDRALPKVATFAAALRPALRAAPGPLRSTSRLAQEVRQLVLPSRLPAALDQLGPITAALPRLESRLGRLVPLVTRANRCLTGNVIPTISEVVPDGKTTTGDPAWLDGLHLFTSVTSFTGGFDGNGAAARAGVTNSDSAVTNILPGLGPVLVNGPALDGVRPAWLGYGIDPPYRPDQWCDEQPRPDLAQRQGKAPGWAPKATPASRRGRR